MRKRKEAMSTHQVTASMVEVSDDGSVITVGAESLIRPNDLQALTTELAPAVLSEGDRKVVVSFPNLVYAGTNFPLKLEAVNDAARQQGISILFHIDVKRLHSDPVKERLKQVFKLFASVEAAIAELN